MRVFRLKYVLPALVAVLATGVFLHAPHLLAQTTSSLQDVGTASGLTAEDPKVIIARIIRVVIGVLGILSVLIVLYGGFTWMTAAGNEEKLERAKKILVRGFIGLAIILMSFAIASFILSALLNSTGAGSGNGSDNGSGGGGFGGSSSTSAFSVTDYSPDGPVAIRNVLLKVTFSKTLDSSTLDGNLVVTNASSGAVVDGTITVSGNSASFRPNTACPSPNEDRYCFDSNTAFNVAVSEKVKSSNGTTLVCTTTSCASSFTTGSLVDTENPTATITVPTGSVESGSSAVVQVHATDDSQVADANFSAADVQFDSVGATGDNLADVTIETNWDTTALADGTSYKLSTTVTDIAGNTSDDTIHVTARGPWCFNDVIDTSHGETGLNCGGDSTSADYCGACSGDVCTTDADCSPTDSCVDGICKALPEITGISPLSGAVGTFVTIDGTGFGDTQGTVTFTSATGTVVAVSPSCSAGWSSSEVVVEVPAGAVSGPITITTGDTTPLSDSSNDDYGQIFDDFTVNDVVHPKLCSLLPNSGAPTDAVVLSGLDFGDSQGSSTVTFGTNAAGTYTSWSDSSLSVTAPSVRDGSYTVGVNVGGVSSNTILYSLSSASATVPIIASVSPASGAIGDYITLTGSNFGADIGSVYFENKTSGYKALASVDFPASCSNYWADTQVTVIVPASYQNGDKIVPGSDFALYLVTQSGATSALTDFTITSDALSPGICAITPDTGAAGDTVTITGSLGTTAGKVSFFDSKDATLQGSWNNESITVTAPTGLSSGPVQVTSAAGATSNTLNFTVGTSSGTTTVAPGPAAYQWYFSTGAIPTTPEIVTSCDLSTGGTISAVPNSSFTTDVCPQAVVYAEFTELMNEGTIDDAVKIGQCSDDKCSSTTDVTANGTLRVTSSTSSTAFTWVPTADLTAGTTYQVTVGTEATSSPAGIALAAPYSWQFTVSSSGTCAVDHVSVSPSTSTITSQYATDTFNALPSDGCVILDADKYVYDWSVDESIAGLTSNGTDCLSGNSSCTLVKADAEGTTAVTATESASKASGQADLTINFTDPYVTDYWPGCDGACRNSQIGASFNTAMDAASLNAPGSVKLYTCPNELCNVGVGDEYGSYTVVADNCDSTDTTQCSGVVVTPSADLTPGTFYRVVIDGSVATSSGVALTRTNYSGDYSWTFGVKSGTDVCAVSRLDVSPAAATASTVGERQDFTASAYGAPDACSTSGQLLTTTGYDWHYANWTDNGRSSSIDVAHWIPNQNVDTDQSGIAAGCTSACVPGGSQAYTAICGDGVVGTGEECEDGNTNSGDGCSSTCLREGGSGGPTWAALCGNGVLDRSADGSGEDCDDGNNINGDGCSATCLDEGSRSVNTTCGNGDVAYNSAQGGEDCDQGNNNVTNGDGCSSICLNEGTPNLTDIGGARCGDRTITSPYETCDDGNSVDGDGCSSHCLLEGSASYPGSSTSYAHPSFCGDGIVGTGEYPACETGAGDGNIDATQLAGIDLHAAQEVDPTTKDAIASMYVTEPTSGISTKLTPTTYTLTCSALQDSDCHNPAAIGVGVNNCCIARPTAVLQPTGHAVCRNAEISAYFTSEMDLATFLSTASDGTSQPLMFAKLDLASTADGLCPADHTTLALAGNANLPWYSRGWLSVRQFFTGHSAAAATNDCVVPVASYSQEAVTDPAGNPAYKVVMHYDVPLVANAHYSLEVLTDSNFTDTTRPGVHTTDGVAMYNPRGYVLQNFGTGPNICTLDSVTVADGDTDSPDYFSQATESHDFTATAYTYNGTTSEAIESLSGVYSWNWAWSDDQSGAIVTVAGGTSSTTEDTATVTAVGKNGTANVIATAVITADTVGSTLGDQIAGTDNVTAFLCEDTWPDIKTEVFPWSDDASGATGATVGSGWMNFSDFYCRDNGSTTDTSDDFPSLTVQMANDYSSTDNILKEYLFEVADGSGDAIGYRVVTNPDYLSPLAWYSAQGFSGSPTVTTADGFQAVVDGRTTYIAAVNQSGTALYPNIYVISYNEGASDSTISIYTQLLANIKIATNISDIALCSTGSAYTTESCTSDADCATGETCANNKIKLTRDVKRLADLKTISAEVATYSSTYGTAEVPTLSSGTFVRGLGASVWSSWTDLLGGALNDSALPADPLNTFTGCGTTPYASYDAATCVNQTTGEYICPVGSHTYHYKNSGSTGYSLYADLEYGSGGWYYDYDTSSTDSVTYQVSSAMSSTAGFTATNFCDGSTIYGSSSSCGDGIVSSSETCELGQKGGTTTVCDADLTTDGADGDGDTTNDTRDTSDPSDTDTYATVSQVCNSTCSGWTTDSTAVCQAATCGDGVVDTALGEECDDGSLNGRYGYCGSTCTFASSFYCGDGSLAGGEACDCGTTATTDARPYGGSSSACTSVNGSYDYNPNNTCAWDCQGPASYCGDGVVDSGEECDGNADSYEGAICDSNSGDLEGQACTTDQDCGAAATACVPTRTMACLPGPKCGSTTAFAACPNTTVCRTGATDKISTVCTTDADCGVDDAGAAGTCSSVAYQTYRTRTCADDGASGDKCTWATSSLGYEAISCKALGSCGDGVVDPNEQCDDGNTDSSDTCTNACTINVCGDGYLEVDTEQCDEGVNNGAGCTSAYESTCTACSTSCKYTSQSGEFCGDGVTNGDEYCDAYDLPNSYVSAVSLTPSEHGTYFMSSTYGSDNPTGSDSFVYVNTAVDCATAGTRTTTTGLYSPTETIATTCQTVGMCNGGDSTDAARGLGAACLSDADCSSGDCQMPVCSNDCTNTCPETYQSSSMLLTDNQPGAVGASSVDLYTYSDDPTSALPNAAEITFPACRVGATLTADVSLDNVTSPDVYVVFVTDLSGSMQWSFAGVADGSYARLNAAKQGIEDSLSALYQVDNMHIGLVTFNNGTTSATANFADSADETLLDDKVTAYDATGGTPTNLGLDAAKSLLDTKATATSNYRKIVVLLTDGEADNPSKAKTSAKAIKAVDTNADGIPDYELYTIALTTDTSFIKTVAGWSSNSAAVGRPALYPDGTKPSTITNIDYAYNGSSSSAVTDAYNSIIDSITKPTVTVVTDGGVATSGSVSEGTGVALPWPEGFTCDPNAEQNLPIRVTFAGEGEINISNVKFNYCAP